jgi:hypothetical protein
MRCSSKDYTSSYNIFAVEFIPRLKSGENMKQKIKLSFSRKHRREHPRRIRNKTHFTT